MTTQSNKQKSQSDILDKIRKLLRLADTSRGATENEAKVALAKAQELMTRHNIDSALLRMERGETSGGSFTVDKGKVDLPKTLNPADLMILSLLQSHFNVKTILMPSGRGTPVDTRFVEENYGKLRNRNTRARRVDSGSYFAGETKGRTIQINRPLPQ